MMAVRWTENQTDAIEARRGTVLVSAAAGSGKTAVLVQRALERLTDPEAPIPADRLLVVTFTRAAAAEMRARLERRLYEMLWDDPKNELLRRQSILLSQANIGTVDSFCAEIVREFFHVLGISPDYRIISDKQKDEMMAEAMAQTLSAAYAEGTVTPLSDAFSGERDDRKLSKCVLKLYEFSQSHPFPERWMHEQAEKYGAGESIENTPWGRVLLEHAHDTAEYSERLFASGIQLAESCGDGNLSAAYAPALMDDREKALEIMRLASKGDWDGLNGYLISLSFVRRGALRGYDGNALKDRLEDIRNDGKAALSKLRRFISPDKEGCSREFEQTYPLIKGLCDTVEEFSRLYDGKKAEQSFLDYSDLEHLAIRLFLNPDGTVTDTGREVSLRFDEIMIDEYQDVNETQDSLFRAISRNGENLFMVGDVKQSIYGFRRAMPEIFLRYRKQYPPYDRERDSYPAYIVLDRNFRSRRQVTDSVNYVFEKLMSEDTGGIDYSGEEMLVYGADYEEKEGAETELVFLERRSNVHMEDLEPVWIAEKIKKLIASGFTVKEQEGERPARFGDFCVLLRSANKYAHSYAQVMSGRGVPAKAAVFGGFFSAGEIMLMTSLLRVIDNPNQDIPLLSVLMSPLYGFTADRMAELRLEDRKSSLYIALVNACGDPLCAKVISDLEQYRALAATMPSDTFLSFLYSRTGYTDMVLAMPGGEVRLENLRLLLKYAGEYESSGYHGISGFVRFMDRLMESDSDLEAAQPPSDGENSVRIMSIHKSKGLEFPVCILAGCSREFTKEKDEILLHPELGMGIRLKSRDLPARYSTAVREAISLKTASDESAEELRVLYVAMTRAKEKLIMLCSHTDPVSVCRRLTPQITENGISPYAVRNGASFAEWLALCALCHPDGQLLRDICEITDVPVDTECPIPWNIALERGDDLEESEELTEEQEVFPPDRELLSRLRESARFVYEFEEQTRTPAKVSASGLAADKAGDGDTVLSRPAWMGAHGLTPAQRGIALHDFMAACDFSAAARDPQSELDRLVSRNILSETQAQAVEIPRIRSFFRDELGKRVLSCERVEKEKRFTAEIPVKMVSSEYESPETVVLQGAVDCVFTEDGRLNIIDFKTDRTEDMEELWRRYETQLELYAYAMEQITGKPVDHMLIYSTWLQKSSKRKYENSAF